MSVVSTYKGMTLVAVGDKERSKDFWIICTSVHLISQQDEPGGGREDVGNKQVDVDGIP